MASNTARTVFREYLEELWSTCPMAWENEPFARPKDLPWVMVRFRGALYDVASIGGGVADNNRWVEEGQTYLAVMVPAGTGTAVASTYAEALALLFRGQTLAGNMRLQTISIGDDQMEDEDGNWWPLVVRVDWVRG